MGSVTASEAYYAVTVGGVSAMEAGNVIVQEAGWASLFTSGAGLESLAKMGMKAFDVVSGVLELLDGSSSAEQAASAAVDAGVDFVLIQDETEEVGVFADPAIEALMFS